MEKKQVFFVKMLTEQQKHTKHHYDRQLPGMQYYYNSSSSESIGFTVVCVFSARV